jgi:translation initiation factor IF-3
MLKRVSKPFSKEVRVNWRIRAKDVRVIGENGEQLGVLPIAKALELANEHNLDLVEVAATSNPPVCRLLDYGRYRYEQTKKERKARQSQRVGLLKEIRVRPRVQEHDLETKIRVARRLLEEGDKVKVFIIFRGREITHPELGLKALQKVADGLKDIAGIDGSPTLNGRMMNIVLSPLSTKQVKVPKVKEEDISAKTKDS